MRAGLAPPPTGRPPGSAPTPHHFTRKVNHQAAIAPGGEARKEKGGRSPIGSGGEDEVVEAHRLGEGEAAVLSGPGEGCEPAPELRQAIVDEVPPLRIGGEHPPNGSL